ncbi:MAG TPA: cystathionine gamma-lyase [Verrucomicrobiae bacterium]|nr:cystathionine gamma-lyase [Verrucomicrobiae bacterium]
MAPKEVPPSRTPPRLDTRIVHAGYRTAVDGSAAGDPAADAGAAGGRGLFNEGPQFAATYLSPGDPASHPLTYGRFHNPTWTVWEEALATLEGGDATAHTVAFASGMAACVAVLGTALKPGDTVVLPSDCYYTVRTVAANWLTPNGIHVRTAPTRGGAQAALLEGARLLWLETPSNPSLEVCDVRALVEAARRAGALIAVDNTTATPYLQQPLALGADYSIASDTKALTGHHDVVLGHVAVSDPERATALRTWRTQHGAIPGPMEVWLAHRSLATLPLRLDRQCTTAHRLAELLHGRTGGPAGQATVKSVQYPGLPDHPGHDIAARQMRAFGSVVSFDLDTRARAEAFLGALTIVREATSFGGVHSTAERRARWGGDAVSEGYIRFSVGCEAPEDILEDVAAALRGLR